MSDHQKNNDENTKKFMEYLQQIDPNLFVLKKVLDETGVSYFTVFQQIRAMYNIAIGSGWGKVTTVIADGVVKYVSGDETRKIEEPVISNKTVDNP